MIVAAVIGKEFSLKQLELLIDEKKDELLELLEEALLTSVIEESPGSGDRFQFTQALIQETVVSELTTARRVRLHLRIGEVLENLYGDSVESHAAELAYHFTQAESMDGKTRLVRYSLLAGQHLASNEAFDRALTIARREQDALLELRTLAAASYVD